MLRPGHELLLMVLVRAADRGVAVGVVRERDLSGSGLPAPPA